MSATRARIIVTTSHRPTQRIRSFVKDLASVLPEAVKINRGKASLVDLYYEAMARGAKRVIVVGSRKGNPGVIWVYEPKEPPDIGLEEVSVISLAGVKLRREQPGAQRTFNTRVLGIDTRDLSSEEERRIADTLARAFLGRLIVSDDEVEEVDVLLKLRVDEEYATLVFICPSSKRICGPVLRVKAVRDNVSGYRLYIPEARGREISESIS